MVCLFVFSAANRFSLQSALMINYTIAMLVNSQWAKDVGKFPPELEEAQRTLKIFLTLIDFTVQCVPTTVGYTPRSTTYSSVFPGLNTDQSGGVSSCSGASNTSGCTQQAVHA